MKKIMTLFDRIPIQTFDTTTKAPATFTVTRAFPLKI